ncbi:acyltransferase domain-containing protein, partial [Couchioplanes caeruleus subsp. azureus]
LTLWPLSAHTPQALQAHAQQLIHHLHTHPHHHHHPHDIAHTLATRHHFKHRATITATDAPRAADALEALARGTSHPSLARDTARAARLAVMFTGQGAQRVDMGRELYRTSPVFADAYDAVAAALALPSPGAEDAQGTAWAQPALFALEVALYRLLTHAGVKPDFVVGHSAGEIAAAHVAGVLSLEDAATLITARGRLMGALRDGGMMVAVRAPEPRVRDLLTPGVAIAAVNGPSSVVVSGIEEEVQRLLDQLPGGKRLAVSQAFHSPSMDEILPDFLQVARTLTYREPTLAVISTVTGRPADGDDLRTPEYWARHIRETVRFGDAIRWLTSAGVDTFVEAGPDAVLTPMVREQTPGAAAVAMLRHDRTEPAALADCLGALWARGVPVKWAAVLTPPARTGAALPTYPFDRRRYWWSAPTPRRARETDVFWDLAAKGDVGGFARQLGLAADAPLSSVVAALADRCRSHNDTVPASAQVEPEQVEPEQVELRERLAGLTPGQQRDVLLETVRTAAVEILGYESVEDIAPDDEFLSVGFVSLSAVELRDRLNRVMGAELPATMVYEHPTPRELAQCLHQELYADVGA